MDVMGIPDRVRVFLDNLTTNSLAEELARPSWTILDAFDHRGSRVDLAYVPTPPVQPDARVAFVAFAPDHRYQEIALRYASFFLKKPEAVDQIQDYERTVLISPPGWSNGMLSRYLDAIGLPARLGHSCAGLLINPLDRADGALPDFAYIHAFPHRILVDGEDHHRTPHKLPVRKFYTMIAAHLAPVMERMPNTVFVPLGPEAAQGVYFAAQEAGVPWSRITLALPEHRKTWPDQRRLFWEGRRRAPDSVLGWDRVMPFVASKEVLSAQIAAIFDAA
jgi:hypothetical protein